MTDTKNEEPKQKACTCKVIEIRSDGTRIIELNHLRCPRHRIKSLEKEGNDFMKQEIVAAAEEKTCDCVIGEGWGAIDSNCPKHGFKYKSIPNLEPAPSLNTWEDLNKLLAVFLGKHVANLGGLSYLAFEKESIQPIQDYIDSQINLAIQKEREETYNFIYDLAFRKYPPKHILKELTKRLKDKGVEEK